VNFTLTHKAGTLPALKVLLELLENDIIHFKIDLNDTNSTTRKHWPVDIGMEDITYSVVPLHYFVNLTEPGSEFKMDVFTFSGKHLYHYESMVFDDYFMILNSTVTVTANESFTGIWGLGERISDFFYGDGVYSSLARDNGSPFDNGKAPGQGMYGVHPVYFGKAAEGVYFGVFNLNANAADWYIKNNK
jgi:hypothetical protein